MTKMNELNSVLQKKNRGIFYTHQLYAEKSLELVRAAIARVPLNNDYIILDRCAGTGNLEAGLTDGELSHCIVSTIGYHEYTALQASFGAKVRHLIPPVETAENLNRKIITGADALSKTYVENPIIRQYIDNPKCTVILFENPPYAETTSVEHQRHGQSKTSSTWKRSFVVTEMKKEVKGTGSNDLVNAFIWSGFKYYLRQPTDSYIVYSPVKYWKVQHLIDKRFMGGFAYNRRHFHTNIDACIMCAYWSNEPSTDKTIGISAFDIDSVNNKLVPCGMLAIKRIFSTYSQVYYDKRTIPTEQRVGILVGLNGVEKAGKQLNRPAASPDIIGYMVAHSSGFDNPDLDSSLLVAARYDGHGFFLRKDNYLTKLPMFCASRYVAYNKSWTERARIMKSADGADRYGTDVINGKLTPFLLKCLLFTCVEMQNHMRTFAGSDGRFYRNELCLDDTHGETIALRDIKKLTLGSKEKAILQQWRTILQWAKKAKYYNPTITYGIYQIFTELDTSHSDEITGNIMWDNIELHNALADIKTTIKAYYNSEIVPVLFEYEFLK